MHATRGSRDRRYRKTGRRPTIALVKAQALSRRRAPRTARTREPLFDIAAVALLAALVFFLVYA